MADIKKILSTIQDAVDKMAGHATSKQEAVYKKLVGMLKTLETRNDVILNNIKNLKLINNIKIEIERIIVDDSYIKEVKSFVTSYNDIQELQNQYFSKFNSQYKPKKGLNIIRTTAAEATINGLTETGLEVGVTEGIRRVLMQNIAQGGSYASMTEQMRNYMLTNDTGEGALERYVKPYSVTAINQFSAEYNKAVADDLGLEWYVYTGSLLETSRDFCIKCIEKKYIHISEFEKLLEGDFRDLGKIHISKSTGLPDGLMKSTNKDNLQRRRGGWNCGHQMIAVNEIIVPQTDKDRVYRSAAYRIWAATHKKAA